VDDPATPLYVRDDEVLALATELQRLKKLSSKTEAVRTALRNEIERVNCEKPLHERLAKAIALAQSIGPYDADFDMKKFTDEMWGDV
jgi:antitoxin VapB